MVTGTDEYVETLFDVFIKYQTSEKIFKNH